MWPVHVQWLSGNWVNNRTLPDLSYKAVDDMDHKIKLAAVDIDGTFVHSDIS